MITSRGLLHGREHQDEDAYSSGGEVLDAAAATASQPLRIAAAFVILAASLMGALPPVLLRKRIVGEKDRAALVLKALGAGGPAYMHVQYRGMSYRLLTGNNRQSLQVSPPRAQFVG